MVWEDPAPCPVARLQRVEEVDGGGEKHWDEQMMIKMMKTVMTQADEMQHQTMMPMTKKGEQKMAMKVSWQKKKLSPGWLGQLCSSGSSEYHTRYREFPAQLVLGATWECQRRHRTGTIACRERKAGSVKNFQKLKEEKWSA